MRAQTSRQVGCDIHTLSQRLAQVRERGGRDRVVEAGLEPAELARHADDAPRAP